MAYRVLIAQFMHETNTFSKLKTTLEDYRKRWLIEGEEMVPRFTGTKNEVGIASLLLCVFSMLLIYVGTIGAAEVVFGLGLVLMIASLALSIWEIQISVVAVYFQKNDIEEKRDPGRPPSR